MNPSIIKRNAFTLAGVSGDGMQIGAVWEKLMNLSAKKPLAHKLSDCGYEIRLYDGGSCTVFVGCAVPPSFENEDYATLTLPASEYASFDVYVVYGYDSENSAMPD